MRALIAQHFSRKRDLEKETANLHNALGGMAASKRDLDAAIAERVEADPFGDFAKAARESQF